MRRLPWAQRVETKSAVNAEFTIQLGVSGDKYYCAGLLNSHFTTSEESGKCEVIKR